jgi:hypothetical protein
MIVMAMMAFGNGCDNFDDDYSDGPDCDDGRI